jgi:HK97 family phage major capsid protein
MPPSPNTISFDITKEIGKLDAEIRKHADIGDELVAKITAEDRDFTADEQKAYDEARNKVSALSNRKKVYEQHLDSRSKIRDNPGPRTRPADIDPDRDEDSPEERKKAHDRSRQEYRDAFRAWCRDGIGELSKEQRGILRSGEVALTAEEQMELRALSSVTGSAGGFTVPVELQRQVITAMKDFSGIMKSRAEVITTTAGNDLPFATIDDTANTGELLAENTQVADQDVAFAQTTLKSYMFSSKQILVPLQLLMDSVIDNFEGFLAQRLGERIGRSFNSFATTGTGTAQPQGVVTFSTLGKTAASATAITYDELVDLQHSVDPAYRTMAQWMFSDPVFALLRKLKDSDGRPIWQPAMSSGAADGPPGTLLGAPYIVNVNMASPTTGQKTVLWGDFFNFKIRQVRGFTLIRLNERYAEKFQVGFIGFARFDTRGINAGQNPIKHLIQA